MCFHDRTILVVDTRDWNFNRNGTIEILTTVSSFPRFQPKLSRTRCHRSVLVYYLTLSNLSDWFGSASNSVIPCFLEREKQIAEMSSTRGIKFLNTLRFRSFLIPYNYTHHKTMHTWKLLEKILDRRATSSGKEEEELNVIVRRMIVMELKRHRKKEQAMLKKSHSDTENVLARKRCNNANRYVRCLFLLFPRIVAR